MAVIDAQMQFSSAQALTTTAVSTNTYDLGVARDVGPGEELYFQITVDTTLASGTSVNFQVISSAAANLSSPNVLIETGPVVTAQLTAGRPPIVIRMPASILTTLPIGQRYIGLQYTIAGTYTAGNVTANLVHGEQYTNKLYPVGTVIL